MTCLRFGRFTRPDGFVREVVGLPLRGFVAVDRSRYGVPRGRMVIEAEHASTWQAAVRLARALPREPVAAGIAYRPDGESLRLHALPPWRGAARLSAHRFDAEGRPTPVVLTLEGAELDALDAALAWLLATVPTRRRTA